MQITIKTYNQGIKQALETHLFENIHVKAIIMGTRSTDPYSSHLGFKNQTDADWPQCMRIHPIIDWTYGDVWEYLRTRGVAYCLLYDIGFTSLGGRSNTHRTKELEDAERVCGYKPAYMLKDGALERSGRY